VQVQEYEIEINKQDAIKQAMKASEDLLAHKIADMLFKDILNKKIA
jgi:hypothetical protein